jgi:CHAT domain-containing protein
LILTLPSKTGETDDGLLTASEVITLKLDADLIILSACNTAVGGTIGGDAFSRLACAFFYAGARALLAPRRCVNSKATVAPITNAFKALKDNSLIGPAEAMRRATSALVTAGGRSTHPANWAPFVMVGEAAAGR